VHIPATELGAADATGVAEGAVVGTGTAVADGVSVEPGTSVAVGAVVGNGAEVAVMAGVGVDAPWVAWAAGLALLQPARTTTVARSRTPRRAA
jgi:carbonic anhydrase/acetyltransferase-like protein (isoleucine patch superfamily)